MSCNAVAVPLRLPPLQSKVASLHEELAEKRVRGHDEQAADLDERARKIPRVAASGRSTRAREALAPAQPVAAQPPAEAAHGAAAAAAAAAGPVASPVPRWRRQQRQQAEAAGGSTLEIPSDEELGLDISARFRSRLQK